MKLSWKFGIIAGIFLAVFALYPQFKMWYLRGNEWQGAYAYNDIDEVAYSAYLNALIDGKPRKNDPYTGRNDSAETPQEESLFSIQFATPYSVAIPARIFGLSTSTAMWLSGAIAAFLATLALFWLIGNITNDSVYAMTGALIVFCLGTLAAGEGAIGEIMEAGIAYPYFPYLRRYVPAVPSAVFWIMCGLVWQMLANEDLKRKIIYAVLASLCFAFTVFSYFYIWTTAAAWLACLVIVWLIVRPTDWLKDFKAFVVLALGCFVSLIFYAYLLSMRSHTMDDVQLLVFTREPDLFRMPEIIGYAVLVMLFLAILLKSISLKSRSTIFAISLALVPFVVFNQQIITGRSLQPIHYQVFIGNYVVMAALVITLGLLWNVINEKISKPLLIGFSLLAIIWGFVECHYTVRVLDEANVIRDEGMAVAKRLRELDKNGVVLSFSMIQADDLPTIAPQSVLWARHQHVFAGVTWQENKERYYQLLYYQGITEEQLAYNMKNGDFVSVIALFGWGRHTDRLNAAHTPLTYGEIDAEARRYGEYTNSFSREKASNPKISYLLIPNDWNMDIDNFRKWYELDDGESIGGYLLYQVKLK
ncbi:MAG: hypothetical protein MUC29_05040 [Pyrinomonadaceae bacterium]|nr:hypothetical protein [Pyrinomonadaceae bacterium]